MRINFIKRIFNIFLCMALVLSLNVRTYADSSSFSAGFTIGGGGKGNPVWSFANIQTHMYKCILVDADGNTLSNFGQVIFYNSEDEAKLKGPNNIGRWPKEKYNSTYNYSARGGCLVCDEIRSFDFVNAATSIPNVSKVTPITTSAVLKSFNFGAGVDFTRNKYQSVDQFFSWTVANGSTTPAFRELCEKLGVYEAIGIPNSTVAVELSVDSSTGALTTVEVNSLDAWLGGYKAPGYHLSDKSANKPYFALCKVDWKVTSGITTTKEKTPDGKTDFIIEKFAEPLQCKPEYSWGNIHPATDNEQLNAVIPQAVSKLGTTNTNLGIVSGIFLNIGGGGSGGGGSSSTSTPTPTAVANITIDNTLEMILFEDELSYNYSLNSSGGVNIAGDNQYASKPNGTKMLNISGSVSPHDKSSCDCRSHSGCDELIKIDTTLNIKRTFNIVDKLVGFMFPNSSLLDNSQPATIESEINAMNAQNKNFSIHIEEAPQGTVNTYYFGGTRDSYYLKFDQRFEGFRTIWQDLRTLWPDQSDTNATTDSNRIKVVPGSSSYQANSPYYLNKYTGPQKTLTSNHDGEISENYSLTWESTIAPTSKNCTGTYKTCACYDTTTMSGNTVHHHKDETANCSAVLTLNMPDMTDINTLSNKVFKQYYELGYENLGDSVAPEQSSYVDLGGKDGQFRRAIVHGESDGDAEHCGRSNILE